MPKDPLAFPGPSLPIDAVLGDLRAALARGHAVLAAPPGSGKTTRAPLALLAEPWLAGRRILMLEPRRPAARLAALRMAQVTGTDLGEIVGYQVRFERRIGPRTRIEVLTEGILTRRLQQDPELAGAGLLIFDEFHERNLQADLALALALDAAKALRPDLRILAMSATLDTVAVSRLLGGAPVIEGEGRSYPVEVRYAEPRPGPRPDKDAAPAVASAVQRALAEQAGDILAFLPGSGEIRRAMARLEGRVGSEVRVLPLHGNLALAEQDLALRAPLPVPVPTGGLRGTGAPTRRVVLATDIAETSLTIEGVTTVIDSGLARKPRFDPGSGLTRLVTEPIPRASAEQRAGRAGRLGPGVCYRLWTKAQEVGRPEHRAPEILQADLAPLVLELAAWGVRDPAALDWLDPPPARHWAQGVALLQQLDLLDAQGAVTGLGRRASELPLHPRLAGMLLAAPADGARQSAADLAALLGERDPWRPPPGLPRPADLGLRLSALEAFRRRGETSGLERHRLATLEKLSRRFLATVGAASGRPSLEPGALLALAYPDRVAKRRPGETGRYLLAAGSGVTLPPEDALAANDLLVVAALDATGSEGRIQLALPIAEAALRKVLAGRIATRERLVWDADREAVAARREDHLGALVLRSHPLPNPDPQAAAALLLSQVERRFDQVLPWTGQVRELIARVALIRRLEPDGDWPDLSEAWLSTHLAEWLGPWLAEKLRLQDLQGLDLAGILLARLDWGQRQRLDDLVPRELTTPAGTRRRLDYTQTNLGQGDSPVLAVPLQEMFGALATPAICGGLIPVTLHLLSPARRPVQVTSDLAGFWARGYAEVRKELRGRYPKHHWPEDPARAEPVKGGVKRR